MITADRVSLSIGGRTILEDVSFRVETGESIALVGSNGSGKTSVLRCLLGLVPFTGFVRIGGEDVVRDPIAARRKVAWLPQRPAFGDVTAREWLLLVVRLRDVSRVCVAASLERVDLLAHADERVRTFSGGMQQRLSLATAMVSDAPVLLLDEPTTSLDRAGQSVLEAEMRGFQERGTTIVIATHRVEEVARWTRRSIRLEAGRIQADTRRLPGDVLRPLTLVEDGT